MRKWLIPAKTFLVGEYAAMAGGLAIVLTTTPAFEMALVDEHSIDTQSISDNGHKDIHPDSPAGRLWGHYRIPDKKLIWHDPYQGKGGLGASSAQFLGVYLAYCQWRQIEPNFKELLEAYYQFSWHGVGLRPSAYDVLAQSQQRCVYIQRQQRSLCCYDWVFEDVAFILLHSGKKITTHHHLEQMTLPNSLQELFDVVALAQNAFEKKSSQLLIEAVDAYQQHLCAMHLVAQHSLEYVSRLKKNKRVLAAKGCGAMGADVLLIIVEKSVLDVVSQDLASEGWTVLANSRDIYVSSQLIQNNTGKMLEILP